MAITRARAVPAYTGQAYPITDHTFVVQLVQNRVMPERCPAFIHYLSLTLRIKILRNFTYDPHDFTLPWFQQRRILLNKIKIP